MMRLDYKRYMWCLGLQFAILVSINAYGDAPDSVILVDPVSKTEIAIPHGRITESSPTKYKKIAVVTPCSYVSLFSVENPNSCPYSWNKLNEFEKDKKLGSCIDKKRLPKPADGWIRIFQSKDSNEHDIYHSLTLVRGNGYALYLLESAYRREALLTPSVAMNTKFKDVIDKRVDNDGVITWRTWIVCGLILLLVALLKIFKFLQSIVLRYFLFVVITCTFFCGMYFYALFPLQISWMTTLSLAVSLYVIMASASLYDFLDRLCDKVLSYF